MSVTGEERHELAEDVEVVVHQVRVAVPPEAVPANRAARADFCARLVTLAEIWARQHINERHSELSEL